MIQVGPGVFVDPLSHGGSGVFTCVDFASNIICCMDVITNCVTC